MMKSHAAATLVMLAAVALAAACTPDRFTDSGCEIDDDCRGERMCVEGRCVGDDPTSRDAGDEDADVDETDGAPPEDDVELPDIGSEEDAASTDLEVFVGQWELEGPVDVLDDEGNVIQQVDRDLYLTRIEQDDAADLRVDVGEIAGCQLLADAVSPNEFEIRASDCTENPVDQVEGAASITGGFGRLSVNGTILELDISLEIDSPDFGGVLVLEFDLAGARTEF